MANTRPTVREPVFLDMDNVHNPYWLLVHGGAKTGKSSFALSVFDWWKEKGKKPEECLMLWLDVDLGGSKPLLERGIVDPEWKGRLKMLQPTHWEEVELYTKLLLKLITEHKEKYGVKDIFVVVDNTERAYRFCRDNHARKVYNLSGEYELAQQRREEALASNKKNLPTFSMRDDWPVIGAAHEEWMAPIFADGANVILLGPSAVYEDTDKETKITTITLNIKGHGNNEFKVSDIIHLTVDESIVSGVTQSKRKMKIDGRSMPLRMAPFNDPSFANYLTAVEYAKAEGKRRGIKV